MSLNQKYAKLKVTLRYTQPLIRCGYAYDEVKDVAETYRKTFTTYQLFYRNKNRLLKRGLIIIK